MNLEEFVDVVLNLGRLRGNNYPYIDADTVVHGFLLALRGFLWVTQTSLPLRQFALMTRDAEFQRHPNHKIQVKLTNSQKMSLHRKLRRLPQEMQTILGGKV